MLFHQSDGIDNYVILTYFYDKIIIVEIQNKPGVYCLRNNINYKMYIGSSKNVRARMQKHRSNWKPDTVSSCAGIMGNVIKKYRWEDFSFEVLIYSDNYLLIESNLIKFLNPEYNTATMNFEKLQPNIGKKFDTEWKSKLGKSTKHNPEVKQKLTRINKQNACKIRFTKEGEIIEFNSWIQAGTHFNLKNPKCASGYFTKTKTKKGYSWKGWQIERLKAQRKKVKLSNNTEEINFNSASECDNYLDLWRGATSNAIRNNQGILHNYKVEYI